MRRANFRLGLFSTLVIGAVAWGCSGGSGDDVGAFDVKDAFEKVEYDVVVVEVLWDVDQATPDDSATMSDDPGVNTPDKGDVTTLHDDGGAGTDDGVSMDAPDQDVSGAEDVTADQPDDGASDLAGVDTGPCVPDCEGKVCGSDGCDGICGFCEWGKVCTPEGTECKTICIPDCFDKGKACGDDGCNGSCGECDESFECKDDFKCHYVDCIPDCTGKECGATGGCGVENECGECGAGQSCTELGHCVIGPCQGVHPEKGKCDGNYVLYCSQVGGQDVLIKIDCTEEPDKVCGWDPWTGKFACIDKPPCVPNCTDKECGDDGCGGSCGACPVGWGCPSFQCRPVEGSTCGYIDETGFCWYDNWLYYCTGPPDTGQIVAENCTQQGKVCAYDSQYTHTYQCMNPL
ncbi:MAG: hypothetical protein GXP54_13685 [Deltaproteobacteria bacterium]|nr:hypothetical protein [Deltaproteobacteria bacterium]